MKKKVVFIIGLVFLCMISFSSVSFAAVFDFVDVHTHVQQYNSRIIEKKEWHYKEIDGKWYRRLFNIATGKYETDWLPV